MTKCAVYCRVSTDEQVSRETVQNQVEFAQKYCSLHELEIMETYTDLGVSGTIALEKREGGARLLQDAKEGKFTQVLVVRLDRFARSLLELLVGIKQLELYGISVRSMKEPYDTSTASGKLMVSLLGTIAEWERALILERTMAGRTRNAKLGKWGGGPTSYGLRVDENGFLDIEEGEADIVQKIFNLSDEGIGIMGILNILNEEGIPTPNATRRPSLISKGWGISTIQSILHNRIYIGESVWRKEMDEDEQICYSVPAIISVEQFERVGQALSSRRCMSRGNAKNIYHLSGFLICQCGKHFVGAGDSNGRRRYRCSSWSTPEGKCPAKIIQADEVEKYAEERMLHLLNHPRGLLDQIETLLKNEINQTLPIEQERARLEVLINQQEKRRQAVIDLFIDGDINREERKERLGDIDQEIAELNIRLSSVSSQEALLKQLEIRLTEMEEYLTNQAKGNVWDAFKKLGAQVRVETTQNKKGKEATYRMVMTLDSKDAEVFSLRGLLNLRYPHAILIAA